ncbi:MAG: glucosaminidase domain-containing protein, partial [Selenomonadaceae bacterium]|nr:glucosaminidase domain-containing protein [Selenomonadaceae bacterium]
MALIKSGREHFLESIMPKITPEEAINAQKKIRQNEGITGFSPIDNLFGGAASSFSRGIGDMATFVGANNVGDFFQSGSDWIEERLKPAKPAEFSWDYITSPEGLARGTGNTIGSMASILLPTAFIPGGAVGTIGRGFQAIPKLGKLFSSASPEMIGRWFASGIPEAAMEAGNWYRNAVANGMDPNEAWDKRWGVFGRNAAFLPVSNAAQWGLFSKVLGGRPIRGGLGELLSQADEEGMQEAFTREVSGLPNTWNPISMVTDPQYKSQRDAMTEGFMGFLLPTAIGMGVGTYRNWSKRNDEKPAETTSQNDTSPTTGNETREGNIFGVENYDMPTQGDHITAQVSQLKNGWNAIIPQIGGVLKEKFGLNGTISSGGRSEEHNAEVGGAPNSYHIVRDKGGDALDIVFDRDTTQEEQDRIADYFKSTGLFSEVLYHDVGSGAHLHLGGLKTGNLGNASTGQENSFDPNFTDRQNHIWQMAQYASRRAKEKYNYDIPPELIYKQWAHESGANFDDNKILADVHNFGGLTQTEPNDLPQPEGGNFYRKFANDEEYAYAYIDDFIKHYPEINGVKSEREFAEVLKSYGYYGDTVENYTAGMEGVQVPKSGFNGGKVRSTGTVDENATPDNSNDPNSIYQRLIADILNEETKPLFDATGDDETTRNILSAFAQDKRESSSGNDFLTLDSMFDAEGNFINSKANRNKLSELYSDELSEFGQTSLDEKLAQLAEKVPSFDKLTDDDRKTLSGVIKNRLSDAGTKVGGHFLKRLNEGDADTFNKALASLGSATATALPEELSTEIARLKDEIKTLSDSAIQASNKAEFAEVNKQIKERDAKIKSITTLGKDIAKLEKDLQAASDNLIKANTAGKTESIAKASDKVSSLQTQLDKKQSELQKIISPQIQDATPQTAPPANQQTADFMTNLDAQIQSLKAQLTPELPREQVQLVTKQIQDATTQLDKINKLNAQINTLTTQAAEAYQNLQNPEKQDAAIKQLTDATKKIQAAETELAKLVTPQVQDATPQPSKKFAPVKAKADEAISTLNNQIDALRMQDETANENEIERLTDSRYAIQATLDELAELDAQFKPLIQARNNADKNNDAKAYNAAKRKIEALSKKYKGKSKELDKLLNPPQETPQVQENFAPVNDEIANELASITQQKSELDAQGRRENAGQITELNKRRDKIQAGNNELAKLQSQAESAETELSQTTDVAKQNALKDRLASLYSKIESKTKALSNFINPPQKQQKSQETFTASADVQAKIDEVNAKIRALRNSGEKKNSAEIANLSRQRDAIQSADNEIGKLTAQRAKAESDGNAQEVNRLTGKIADLNNKLNAATQRLDKVLNPPQKPKPKEKPQNPAKPVNRQTAQAISRLESDIEQLDDRLMSDLSDEQYSAVKAQYDAKRKQLDQIKTLNEEIAAAQKQKNQIREDAKKARESGDEATSADLLQRFKSVNARQWQAQAELDHLVSEPVSDEVAEAIAKLNDEITNLKSQIVKSKSRDEKSALLKKLDAKEKLRKNILNTNSDVVAAKERLENSSKELNRVLGSSIYRDEAKNAAQNDYIEAIVAYEQAQEQLDKLINPPAPKESKTKSAKKSSVKNESTTNVTPKEKKSVESASTSESQESQPKIEPAVESKAQPSQVETQTEKKSPAKAKPQESPTKAEQQESTPAETQKQSEQNDEDEFTTDDGSIFGSIEAAERDLLESLKELGIEPLDTKSKSTTNAPAEKDTRRPKLVNFVDDSDEALEKAIAEWNEEVNKISSMPMFNPKIWVKALELGGIYVQRGINSFADWAKKMTESIGKKSEPWQAAVWETLKTLPSTGKFNDKQIQSIAKKIGALYESGTTELEDIEKDFAEKLGAETTQAITPMIRASYAGIKKFFVDRQQETESTAPKTKKAANNGEQSQNEHSDKDESETPENVEQPSSEKATVKNQTADDEKNSLKEDIADGMSPMKIFFDNEGLESLVKRVSSLTKQLDDLEELGVLTQAQITKIANDLVNGLIKVTKQFVAREISRTEAQNKARAVVDGMNKQILQATSVDFFGSDEIFNMDSTERAVETGEINWLIDNFKVDKNGYVVRNNKKPTNEIIFPKGALTYGDSNAVDGFKGGYSDKNFDENNKRKVTANGREMTRLEVVEGIAKGELDESAMKLNKREREYLTWLREKLIEPLKAIQQSGIQNERAGKPYQGMVDDKSVYFEESKDDAVTLNQLTKLAEVFGGTTKKNSSGNTLFNFPTPKDAWAFTRVANDIFMNNVHVAYFNPNDTQKTERDERIAIAADKNQTADIRAQAALELNPIDKNDLIDGVKVTAVQTAQDKKGVWRVKLVGTFPIIDRHIKNLAIANTNRLFNGVSKSLGGTGYYSDDTFHFKDKRDATAFKTALDIFFGFKKAPTSKTKHRPFVDNADEIINFGNINRLARNNTVFESFKSTVKALGDEVTAKLKDGTLTQSEAEEIAGKLMDEFDEVGRQFDAGEITQAEA